MSGSSVIPSTPLAKAAGTAKVSAPSGREDKPLKRLVIHLILIATAIIAAFPILRVFSVALRPGNKLLDPTFTLIPEGATLESFQHVLSDRTCRCGSSTAWS
jgi:arabinogalactan oligomer/maltooligosaccharide transport system permease protein